MPLGRGENIGSAYIKIYADGRGLDKSIRDSFDEAEPGIRESGEHHADAYAEAYNRRLRSGYKKEFGKTQKELFDEANDALTRSLARTEFAERTFRSPQWKEFKKRMANEYGDAGRLAAKQLRKEFETSGDLDALPQAMERMGPRIDRARAEIVARQAAALDAARAAELKAQRDFVADQEKLERDRARAARESSRQTIQAERRATRERREALQELIKTYQEYRHQAVLLERGDRDAAMSRRELVKGFRDLRESTDRAGFSIRETLPDIDRYERHVGRLTPTLGRLNGMLDRTSDRIGTAFGRGSRNNFLNFFGSVVRNATRVLFLLPKITEKVIGMGKGFANAFTGAGGGLSGLQAGLLTLGPALATGVAGVVVLGGALAALSIIIGPLISLISLLAGVVLALASTIAFALVGAVAALASVVAPLIIGFGGLAIAIGTMHKKSDELKNALKDVKNSATALGDAFRSTGFRDAPEQLARVSHQLHEMQPLARAAGRGMREFVNGLLDGFDSHAFMDFRDMMETHLPSILSKLGKASGNVFNGMWGTLRSLVPLAERFSSWLVRVTDEWSKWSNSKEGQASMRQFWRDAEDSLHSFWGLLKETGGLIGDMFSSGRTTGDHFFDGLTQKVQEFREFLGKPIQTVMPANDLAKMDAVNRNRNAPTAMDQWFKDVKKFGDELGTALRKLTKLLDELDTKHNRTVITDLIEDVGDLIEMINTALALMDLLLNPQGAASNSIVQGWAEDIAGIGDSIAGLFDPKNYTLTGIDMSKMITLPDWPKIISDALGHFSGLGAKIKEKIGPISLGNIFQDVPKAIANLLNPFKGTNKRIKDKIGKVNVGGIIEGIGHAIDTFISPWKGKGKTALKNIGKINVGKVVEDIGKAIDSFVDPWKGRGKEALKNIGDVDVGKIVEGIGKAIDSLVNPWKPTSGAILRNIGKVNVAGIISGVGTAVSNLVSPFRGLASTIANAIGTITPHVNLPDIPGVGPPFASGGILNYARHIVAGEAGAEAIVPLQRPLGQVDPSVRWLSAIAQGKIDHLAAGGMAGSNGRTVNVDMTVMTTAVDPRAAANEVVNHLVAVGY